EVILDVPPRTQALAFGFRLSGGGEMWVDDVRLEPVPRNSPGVASTPSPVHEKPMNLDFEDRGMLGPFHTEGWFLAGNHPERYRIDPDSTTAHSGASSGHLWSTVENAPGFGTLMQECKADDHRGKRVRFSAFVKSQDVKSLLGAGLW